MNSNTNSKRLDSSQNSEILLHYQNWFDFERSIFESQVLKFGVAGEEIMKSKKIDWENLRPDLKSQLYNLLPTIKGNVKKGKKNKTQSIESTEEGNEIVSENLLISTNNNIIKKTSSSITETYDDNIELVNSNKIDYDSVCKLTTSIRNDIIKLQIESAGNSAGLVAYVTDLNAWKAEYLQYISDRKKLWIFLLKSMIGILKAEITNSPEFKIYKNEFDTLKLWIQMKTITVSNLNECGADLRQQLMNIRQKTSNSSLMPVSLLIQKYDRAAEALNATSQKMSTVELYTNFIEYVVSREDITTYSFVNLNLVKKPTKNMLSSDKSYWLRRKKYSNLYIIRHMYIIQKIKTVLILQATIMQNTVLHMLHQLIQLSQMKKIFHSLKTRNEY